jgi:hypothetical protein
MRVDYVIESIVSLIYGGSKRYCLLLKYLEGLMDGRTRRMIWNYFGFVIIALKSRIRISRLDRSR